MSVDSLIELRATVAERDEDLRIARKHAEEAAERVGTPENVSAYRSAVEWQRVCADRAADAHGALIRAAQQARHAERASHEAPLGSDAQS